MFEFLNPIVWLIALASLIAWARFTTFISKDVDDNLRKQSPLMWRSLSLGILLLMFIVFVFIPSFWLSFPLNILIAGGGVAGYWVVRVGELGKRGHLFKKAIDTASKASKKVEDRRIARQVMLTYLRHDDSPMPLPRPEDPVAAGLATADQIVIQALTRRAEQVDLAPSAHGYELKFSIDGVPSPQPQMGRTAAEPAIQAIKILGGLSLEERRRPQVGKFKTRDADGVQTVWTVRTSGTTAGERLNLSANEKGKWDMGVDQLGMIADQLSVIREVAADTAGVVLVATPRGAGRTTTLYALLRQHDAFTNSVQTLETNPQAEIQGVTINRFDTRNADVSYAKTLNSLLLKDPNVLMTAQCPDAASAEVIARYGAGTGGDARRIYVGLPAFDTMAALEMWLSLVPDKAVAIDSLRMIMSQRLVRILCPTCKIPYQPDENTLKRLNLPIGRNLQSFKGNSEPLVDKKGNRIICPECGGVGYRGRTGIFEVMVITDEIKKALAANANTNQVKALARKNNMILLVEHGIRKFASGVTAINEVTRVLAPEKGAPASASSGVMPAQK